MCGVSPDAISRYALPPYTLTEPAVAAFVVIPVLLLALLVWGVASTAPPARRGTHAALTLAGGAAWLALTWFVAARGLLLAWQATPPPFTLLVAAILVIALSLALRPVGARLATGVPLWVLILVQGFRLPLELAMHALVARGLMPEQMSYTGRNLDIVTGASAIVVALVVRGAPGAGRAIARLWNGVGLLLVVNVMAVGILSTPRFALFGADQLNVFIAYPPFVWLPAAMVLAALTGHLLVFRALVSAPGGARRAPART